MSNKLGPPQEPLTGVIAAGISLVILLLAFYVYFPRRKQYQY
eukprot:gene2557-5476_t